MSDLYPLINDLFGESVRFVLAACIMVAGVLVGKKIRNIRDAKKNAGDNE